MVTRTWQENIDAQNNPSLLLERAPQWKSGTGIISVLTKIIGILKDNIVAL